MRINTRVLTIFLIVFVDSLGFGIILPIMPVFAQRFSAGPQVFGLLFGIFSFAQFFALPILGYLSDVHGRRKILSLSLFGTAIGYFLTAVAANIPMLFIGRFIDGATGGNQTIAQAYISDVTEEKDRARAMGIIGSAVVLGLILGPIIGGFFGGMRNGQLIFFVLAGVSLVNTLFTLLFLREQKARETKNFFQEIKDDFLDSPWRNKILLLMVIGFVFNFGFSLIYGTVPFFTKSRFDVSELKLGYLLAVLAVIAALTQIFVASYLYKEFGDRKMLVLSCFILGGGLMFLGIATQHRFILLDSIFVAIGLGLINPTLFTSLSLAAPEEGMGFGIYTSATVLATALGSTTGGYFFASLPVLPYLIGGALILLTGVIIRIKKHAWEAYNPQNAV